VTDSFEALNVNEPELAKLRGETFSAQESRVKSKIKSAFS
jgi:hypothetical protein